MCGSSLAELLNGVVWPLDVVASPSNATWLVFGAFGGSEGFPF